MLNTNYHDDHLFPRKILLKILLYLLLGFVWFLMFWYSQFDILKTKIYTYSMYSKSLDLFKKLQEPNPTLYPTPIMSKAIGLWKNESNFCNIILHLGNKVKMGLHSHNIRRYLISIGGIGCTCDPVVRCVHTWISGPSREVESFFNVLYGKSCIQPQTIHNLRNYYNFNKEQQTFTILRKFVSPRMKKISY
jgi:hypothetical protein